MTTLTGSSQPIVLAPGYFIRTPGFTGEAELKIPRVQATYTGPRAPEDGTTELNAALTASSVEEVRQIDLRLTSSTSNGDTRTLRTISGQEMLEVGVPDFGDVYGHVVLNCDETGALTWHFPEPDAGTQKRFLIPATPLAPRAQASAQSRGLIGVLGRKLLKVLVYPLLDPVLGAIADRIAGNWERSNRPYGFRDFSPENFRSPLATPLGSADWARLSKKRALLFVHGTFSTAHACFGDLDDHTFGVLHDSYEGRVFAFNHHTLSHDPTENIRSMLEMLPAAANLELDIVSHSRGGLVARALAEYPSPFGLDTQRVKVRRVVFAGVPNSGTPLADPEHMVAMIDRFTTVLNLFPSGPITETLEALITVIKVIGHGALKSLDGLASMRPDGEFLRTLNNGSPQGTEYYALAANFEPRDNGLKVLISGTIANTVLDRIFEDAPNDLVVPELGVFGANGSDAFPITDAARKLQLAASSGYMHTNLFSSPTVQEQLLKWLT
ncbi:esterase/lipase family protein [Pseudomonas laurentiana]